MPLNDNPDRIQAFLNSPFTELLSLSEFAEARGVDESAIRHAIKNGRLKPYVDVLKLGKQWVISRHAWKALDGNYAGLNNLSYACHIAMSRINKATGKNSDTEQLTIQ